MTEYGTMLNHQLIRHKKYHDGDKPIQYTEAPQLVNGYRYTYRWVESDDVISQVWNMVEDSDTVYDDYAEDAADADYEEALGRFGV